MRVSGFLLTGLWRDFPGITLEKDRAGDQKREIKDNPTFASGTNRLVPDCSHLIKSKNTGPELHTHTRYHLHQTLREDISDREHIAYSVTLVL